MKKQHEVWSLLLTMALSCFAVSQDNDRPPAPVAKATSTTQQTDTQQKNVDEYIELLRSNVRQEKAQVLGAVLKLDATDAAKFWPVYKEYDTELSKLNKLRSDNIQEYARAYDQMSDAKADQLIKTAVDYQKQRTDLLGRYYGRVKDSIGSVQAARFIQIENQLLMIIDLQIASSLPLIEGSDASQGEK
jgi:hypothetical protein